MTEQTLDITQPGDADRFRECDLCKVKIDTLKVNKTSNFDLPGQVKYAQGEGSLNHCYTRLCQHLHNSERPQHNGKSCLFKTMCTGGEITGSFASARDVNPAMLRKS